MEPAICPAVLHVESEASTDLFGSCLQASIPASSTTGGQLALYSAATPNDPIEKGHHNMEIRIQANPIYVFEKRAHEFKLDVDMMKTKIHRYPPTIRALGGLYTVPKTVAIGPYHHNRDHLKAAEKVKHVAAYHCIRESGRSVQEIYHAVVSVAGDARRLYDSDAVTGIGDDDFLPMMFYDACFLVQYMLTCTRAGLAEMDPALRSFFDSNDNNVYRDIMLLENQLPWRVVETVMRFRPVSLTEFVASLRGCLQDRKIQDSIDRPIVLDESYEPPHLLGLLRFYIVGRSEAKLPALPETEAISFSVSTIELAEIGVTLTANNRTELINMGDADDEDSAVCSYLLLLGMIVDREEDVHELRRRRILQGGGGHHNKEALDFLTSLQGLRLGSRYVRTMEEIENYKVKRRTRTKVHAFVYRNMKTLVTVVSTVTAVVGIVGTLKSLKVIH
ncbi:unnamed protein product [Urochloa decumbens]|uniref:Uncharacterized protein n=1 Tax=Urochloa decumbens TaxID=240449 RepID=A0ABC9GZB3_9POAL